LYLLVCVLILKYHEISCSILIFIFSCNKNHNDDSIACTDLYAYGLNVSVRDADTNLIISEGITVTATDGNYSEELMFGIDSYIGAGERPGNYIITATGLGHQSYTSEVITVEADECHVIGESLEIQLQSN